MIPRKGRPGKARQAHEHRRAFRRTVKWRTGSEARISTLKRQYGWDRTLWVPRTMSRPLISAFAASQPRSHGSQAAQQDLPPWPFDSRT